MFEKFSEESIKVIYGSYNISTRFKSHEINTAHLLAALTLEPGHKASEAFQVMNISAQSMNTELERQLLTSRSKDIDQKDKVLQNLDLSKFIFSQSASAVLRRASDIKLFFGKTQVFPEHLLLAILDIKDEVCLKMFEELGANPNYLQRLILSSISKVDAISQETPKLRDIIVNGLNELVLQRVGVLQDLKHLASLTEIKLKNLPDKSEIAYLIFIAYLSDFLFVQIGYQRYVLEEIMRLLRKRVGNLDPEFSASTISSSVQNLRIQVQSIIEYIWSHEFRSLSKFPDEAEYDLLGSVIEDLWWTHSEEIALNDVFSNAVEDHRREQMLDLQKRRLEIAERFLKLKIRLTETIKQSFTSRSVSA